MAAEINKASVRRFFEEGINKGNFAVLKEIVAKNYVINDPQSLSNLLGPELLERHTILLRTAFADFHYEINDIFGEDTKVAVRWTFHGTHTGEYMRIAPTGRNVTITGITIFRVVDGKIQESWNNTDDLGMNHQLLGTSAH